MSDETEPPDGAPSGPVPGPPAQPGPAPQPSSPPPPTYPSPQYGQPQYGQPQYGPQQYGPPQYGPPQYGPPQYGPPQYGQPPDAEPGYAQPPYPQPGYAPAQQPPYAAPGRPARSALTVTAAVGSVLFVVATAILAYVANHADKSEPAGAGAQGPAVAPGGVSQPGQQSAVPLRPSAIETVTSPPVTPTPITPTSTVPSEPLLDPEAINRTFQGYMNALVDHDLAALHSTTCPQLRHTEVGFELHGNYVSRWRGKPYTISPGIDYVTIFAAVSLRDPGSGASAGSATYSWHVERESSGHYYVCGFLS